MGTIDNTPNTAHNMIARTQLNVSNTLPLLITIYRKMTIIATTAQNPHMKSDKQRGRLNAMPYRSSYRNIIVPIGPYRYDGTRNNPRTTIAIIKKEIMREQRGILWYRNTNSNNRHEYIADITSEQYTNTWKRSDAVTPQMVFSL